MAVGLKVRLDDGSEVGPLDLVMVQTWFQQGLIGPETMVQKAGTPRWGKLSDAVDLRQWNAPLSITPRARSGARGAASTTPSVETGASGDRWRLHVASGILLVLALAAALAAVWPDRVRPDLDGAPWVQTALALFALALLLARGWDLGRRAVRAVALLAAVAAFPLAGLFVARGMRREALLVVASSCLLATGLFAFLAPALSRLAAGASLLAILAGGAGLARFSPAEASAGPAVSPWASGEPRISEKEMGLDLVVPAGWMALKPGNPLVPAPPGARATLAQPRVSAYAFLLIEPAPRRVLALEHYLDYVIAGRRAAATSFEEEWRRDGRLGSVTARRASNRRVSPEGRYVERITAAQDGDRYFALIAGAPEVGGARALEEIDVLEKAISLSGARDAARREAVERANLGLPHLSVRAIEGLVAVAGPLDPAALFRLSVENAARGLSALGGAAMDEEKMLTTAAFSTLPPRDRAQLADYLRRVGAAQPTLPGEDERMRLLMKAAIERLSAASRARLQQINENALSQNLGG
jgi:hypothetical protein